MRSRPAAGSVSVAVQPIAFMPTEPFAPRPAAPVFTRRQWLTLAAAGAGAWTLGADLAAQDAATARKAKGKAKDAGRIGTPPPTKPPLDAVELARLPAGVTRLDLFLLIGQSNMKGRGFMPAEPKRDPRLVMMSLKDDEWYLARHPLHLTGDPRTFDGADNAGVGPGLAFAEAIAAASPNTRVGLVPCAVGGSAIALWQKGARLHENAVRRAKLAMHAGAPVPARIRGALWLQGEADATDERIGVYEEKLHALVRDLRAELGEPELPFVACTIGEMSPDGAGRRKADLNAILLRLPDRVPRTACVDARDIKTHIGDAVHFDTAAQEEIGRRYAAKYRALTG